jgi:translation initiation factor 2B subunit (eIF-2B alpha/beta/delta family)
MNIPSNFSLEEAIKELDLPSEVITILEQSANVQFDIVYDLEEEIKSNEAELEKLQKVQKNAKNLVSWFEQELLCKDFRYKETKNLVKKLLSLIEAHNLEI